MSCKTSEQLKKSQSRRKKSIFKEFSISWLKDRKPVDFKAFEILMEVVDT